MTEEITDELRSVLQIKFNDGSKLFLSGVNYMAVGNPIYATRYPPIDGHKSREDSQKRDKKWMESEYDAEISFVPFIEAVKEYKQKYE